MKYTSVDWKELKKHFRINNQDVADMIGAKKHTVDVATSPKHRFGLPKWAILAIWVFNEMKNKK